MKFGQMVYRIDGCIYSSKMDVEHHLELKDNPLVKTFRLPSKTEKSRYSKYGAYKCMINDIVFDSIMEGRYYVHLLGLMNNNAIKSFERQVKYVLIPSFKDEYSGKRIREVSYTADFVIEWADGHITVIDVKGRKAPEFRIKEKLLRYKNPGIDFVCIQWDKKTNDWRNLDDIKKEKKQKRKA